MELLATLLLLIGFAFLVIAPIALALIFYLIHRIGQMVQLKDPELWESMRPGFYDDIGVSRAHRQRLNSFISGREYLSLDRIELNRMAGRFLAVKRVAYVTCFGGPLAAIAGLILQ
jgi:type IV secretory pathway VirB3-like protein